MKKQIILLFQLFLALSVELFAQRPPILFSKTYGSDQELKSNFHIIIPTKDGNYAYVATTLETSGLWGSLPPNQGGSYEPIIGKLDANFQPLWSVKYGGSKNESGFICPFLFEDSKGDLVYVTNCSSTDGTLTGVPYHGPGGDVWILRLSGIDGHILSNKMYGSSDSDELDGAALTPDDGVIFTSTSTIADGDLEGLTLYGGKDAIIMCTDSLGNIVWKKNYGGSSYDWGANICSMADGSYITSINTRSEDHDLTGYSHLGDFENMLLIKLDSQGFIIKKYYYICGTSNITDELIKIDENNIVLSVGGCVEFPGHSFINEHYFDYSIFNPELELKRRRMYTTDTIVYAWALNPTFPFGYSKMYSDGQFIYCTKSVWGYGGDLTTQHLGYGDLTVMKVDTMLNVMYSGMYGTYQADAISAMCKKGDSVILVGTVSLFGPKVHGDVTDSPLSTETQDVVYKAWLCVIDDQYIPTDTSLTTVEHPFVVYPNPTDGILYVDIGDYENLSIEIYTLDGKLLLLRDLVQSKTALQLPEMARQTLILSIKNQQNKVLYSQKIMKQ